MVPAAALMRRRRHQGPPAGEPDAPPVPPHPLRGAEV